MSKHIKPLSEPQNPADEQKQANFIPHKPNPRGTDCWYVISKGAVQKEDISKRNFTTINDDWTYTTGLSFTAKEEPTSFKPKDYKKLALIIAVFGLLFLNLMYYNKNKTDEQTIQNLNYAKPISDISYIDGISDDFIISQQNGITLIGKNYEQLYEAKSLDMAIRLFNLNN